MGAKKRKALGKKARFEVLKRDGFQCQYCGARAPDVLLHVDHINPVTEGGGNDMLNLTTSCGPCNLGKGPRKLDDSTAMAKQVDQLAELQARRDQLDDMFRWKTELQKLDDDGVGRAGAFLAESFGRSLNDHGVKLLRKVIRQHGLAAVLDAIPVAECNYIEKEDGETTFESFEIAFGKIGGICRVAKDEAERPYMRDLYYIRGIIRNRHYSNHETLPLLEAVHLRGASVADLRSIACASTSWSNWKYRMECLDIEVGP